ncbi:syntaxin-12 [Drosophila tropicalis]|uniref:syntaxin-12 n=1 Tax=Drosophila tropicalis TaxID=46794 RepID=UPI0035AB8D90
MSQALNPSSAGGSGSGGGAPIRRDYGATADSASVMPDVNFTSPGGSSGFSPTEFMSLSEDIGHNITSVLNSSKQLEKQLKFIGTPKDLPALHEKIHGINTKTNAKVETTRQDLERLKAVVRHGDRQQKLQWEKLTQEFQNVIEKYSSIQKRISSAARQSYQQLVTSDQEAEVNARAELLQEQRQAQASMQQEHDMLVERERQLSQLAGDVIDTHQIMGNLRTLVLQQGEQLDLIENSIDQAASHVEEGRSELAKAARSRQSYRRKILILLVIAVIIGLIVTGIVVAKFSS